MSLPVVIAIAAGYVALVLFVVAVLTAAKRADEEIERVIRAEGRHSHRFDRQAPDAEVEEARSERGAAPHEPAARSYAP